MSPGTRLVVGSWEELGTHASAVRRAVFIDEQAIPESMEWDEHDALAQHCVAFDGARAVGTGRLLDDGRIGRMAVMATARRTGLGGRILERLIDAARERADPEVRLSAQTYVLAFYRRHGFVTVGDVYDEAGIAHQDMVRALFGGEVSVRTWMGAARPSGPELHHGEWRPARAHGGGVYLLHGLGEHLGRYDALARWWCARGWTVRAHDHAGHGRSSGARGVIPALDALQSDARAAWETFGTALGRAPLLLGHSMGGAIAADLVVARGLPVPGLVLSSPALALRLGAPMRWLAEFLLRVAPARALGNGLDPAFLSHDGTVVQAYRDDPLVHDRICARLLKAIDQAGRDASAAASRLSVPTLLLAAGDDRLVDPEGSRRFAAQAPTALLGSRVFETGYHELFNETSLYRQAALDELERWLLTRFPDPTPA